jgi:5-methylthioadenosine/S-adenosylhomocysteine deaminase
MLAKHVIRIVLLLSFGSSPCFSQQTNSITLKGTLVTPSEIVQDGLVTVSGNRIADVSGSSGRLPPGTIDTDALIFPGLIDLHDHITWNFLPRWKPGDLFNNRYDWQQTIAYKIALDDPHARIFDDRTLACDADRFGEIKAIVGGSTSVVGSLTPTPNTDDNACIKGLARNLDNFAGFEQSVLNKEPLRYEVFPFEMQLADATKVRADLDSGTLKAFLIHVGEGKPSDASAAREFRMLAKRNDGFLRPGVSVIHGVALGKDEFSQMATAKVGLIWSPRSNIELYGATTDVRSAKEAGVKIALAPDWSPSGSDGMLEELKYAATWNASQTSPVFSDQELVAMATVTPAQLAGADKQIGTIQKGLYADLLLVRRSSGNPYQTLLHASPAEVRLVIVGGIATYGDPDLMAQLLPGKHLEIVTVCGTEKALYIEPQDGLPQTKKSLREMSDELDAKLARWGTSIAELAPCHGSNLN